MAKAVLFGSYELLDRIGEGGMAEVWRARSRGAAGFEKIVVIKRVLPDLMARKGFADFLVREAKIAALLSHPNIVQIFDLGEESGAYFIVMEYVHGRDFAAALQVAQSRLARARDGLSIPLRLWIVAEACKALDYAHRIKDGEGRPLNIVHRDVSPQNILLSHDGAVKVADFGIARADQSELGKEDDPRVLRGKYAYMSPEQARGEPLDQRSDLFALGIVLYEALTHKRLFRGPTSAETLSRVKEAKVPAIDHEGLGIPEGIVEVLRRALAHDREDRYAAAGEMGEDLSQLLFEAKMHVGQSDLAKAMLGFFPRDEEVSPNKLRVDLMMRAYEDASTAAVAEVTEITAEEDATEATGNTRAFPVSRSIRSEIRSVVLLALPEEGVDGSFFESVMHAVGGTTLPSADGVREAVFGHSGAPERAAEHAARAALELMRRWQVDSPERSEPIPPMAIVEGKANVFEVGPVEPLLETRERAQALLEGRSAGDVRVSASLRTELGRVFRLGTEPSPRVLGYRGRRDRDALALRERGPFVGRREQLRLLSTALLKAAKGGGDSAFLLVGEPGSGKSRMVAELCAMASQQDVMVAHARGDSVNEERSYGVLADLFGDLCGVGDDDDFETRFGKVERLRVLGLSVRTVRVVGELLGLAYPVARRERVGRPRGIELTLAARSALRALSVDRPLLLILEDLHWADEPVGQLLPLLLKGLAGAPVVTVLTTRPGPLHTAIPAERMDLAPLTPAEAARLFAVQVGARALEPDLVDRVDRETFGNPGWVEAMADSLLDAGWVEIENSEAHVIGDEVTPITERHLALCAASMHRLPRAEIALAEAASALGEASTLATLAAVSARPLDMLERGVRRLLSRRVFYSEGTRKPYRDEVSGSPWGNRVSFELPESVCIPAELMRRAMLERMQEKERRRLHGVVTAFLERDGAAEDESRIEDLAFHALRSTDRRRAVAYLEKAAEVAQRQGRDLIGAKHLAEAARLEQEFALDPTGRKVLELAVRAAELALSANDTAFAERILSAYGQTATAGSDAGLSSRLLLARARSLARKGAFSDAAAVIENGLEGGAGLEDAELEIELRVEAGSLWLYAGEVSLAIRSWESARARGVTDKPELEGRIVCGLATAHARLGDSSSADSHVAKALALTARLGSGSLRYRALEAMGEAELSRRELGAAAARLAEAAEVASEGGFVEASAWLHARAAAYALLDGEEEAAISLAHRALCLGQQTGLEVVTLVAQGVQATLAVLAHPDPVHVPRLVGYLGRLEDMGSPLSAALLLQLLALAHLRLGDEGAAQRSRSRAAELAQRGGDLAASRRLLESS